MRYGLAGIAAAIAIVLSGCWDKIELNERAYVNAVSIDKAVVKPDDPEQEDKRFTVGVALSDLKQHEGNDKGGENDAENKSVKKSDGQAVSSAIRNSELRSSQKLFFGHAKAAFLGSELLKDEQLFMEALDALERDKELSRRMLVLATENEASEVIGIKPQGEPSIGVFADNFYKRGNTGVTFRMTLEDLFIRLRSDKNAIIPRIEADKDELKIGGTAVIKNMTLCGFLDENETRGYLWQTGNAKGTKVIVRHEGVPVPFTTLKHSKKVRFHDEGGILTMTTYVSVEGSVDEYIFGKNVHAENMLEAIEELVAEQIKKETGMANDTFQNKMCVDAMNTNEMLKKKNYELWEKFSPWQEAFENMTFDVRVAVKINSAGLIR